MTTPSTSTGAPPPSRAKHAPPASTDARSSPDVVTVAELRRLVAARRTKYGSRRTWVPELNRWFASGHEAEQAVILLRRQQAGEVRDLLFQVAYPLHVDDEVVCTYYADYVFDERRPDRDTAMGEAWVHVVADAKSPLSRTPVYRLKKRLMAVCLGLEVREL